MMSDRSASPVLQPVTLGGLQLKNRIVMAPMTRSRADDAGVQPDYVAEYYGQRAGAIFPPRLGATRERPGSGLRRKSPRGNV
jgi:hypothetical protein